MNGPGCNAQTATSDQIRGDGFICGAQASYNWQINNWVLGIEADFQGAAIKGSVAAPIFLVAIPILSAIENAIEKLEWFGTVRGRLGVAFDRVFVYGTGGFAFLHPSQKPVGPPVVASNGHSPANGRPRSRVSTTISVRSLQLAALQTGLWWVKFRCSRRDRTGRSELPIQLVNGLICINAISFPCVAELRLRKHWLCLAV
ncbi:MAG: hypothetical protein WA763_08955 [Pseudolabrys sp.]